MAEESLKRAVEYFKEPGWCDHCGKATARWAAVTRNPQQGAILAWRAVCNACFHCGAVSHGVCWIELVETLND